NRLFLAEANQWPEDVLPYFGEGDECHMAFHFPLMPRIYMALAQEDRHPIVEIMHQTPEIPERCQWAIFLRNHDELTLEMVTDKERDYMYQTYATDPRMRVNVGIRRRLASMMENDRPRIELLNSLLMSMPGTPIIYYGDEIGMGDNIFLGDRDAVRTPMQWTSDRNAGFSRTEPARLYLPPIMDPVHGYESVNVEAQSRSAGSLLNWMKRIISVRKAHRAFGRGTLEFLHPGNRKVIAYLREHDDESMLCVANLSRSAQPVELDLARFRGLVPVELLGNSSFPPLGDLPYFLTLPGYGFYWFRLAKEAAAPRWHQESPRYAEPPVVVLPAGRETAHRVYSTPLRLPSRQLAQLEREALPN
ncbi:MAG TPA: alpha-glucosidase C-terminal domain-containing protein, partial [Rubrobacter sp.]|nr:alpha-glucosidase C-terminal domain-containing protein [Rubrobacter sp.]